MTDKQDPIAHAARLLREAAEELRQAHTYHRSEGWQGETGAQSAYDVYMAAAQALEDWEAAVGAGGVQALQPEGGPPGSGGWQHHAETMERERDHWRERARTMEEHQRGTVWYWQGDGNDHPESMVNSLPVVIRADQLRALIASGAQALSAAPARDERVPEAWTNLLAYVLQDDMHNRLTPRVIDIAYTAFTLAKQPNSEDGGTSDWFNDTKPAITEMIEKLRKDLIEDRGASPTPPAEQQAEESLTKLLAECRDAFPIPEPGSPLEVQWAAAMARPDEVPEYARLCVAAMQSAPKAAPGEPTQEMVDAVMSLVDLEMGDPEDHRYDDGSKLAAQICRAVLALAPQQEAQEPALFVSAKQLAALTDPDDPDGEHGRYLPVRKTTKGLFTQALYTAPQPAPAPLSEMPYEKRKAIQEGEQIGASDAWFKARHEMLDTVDRRNVFRAGFDRGWNAALAAQERQP